MNDDQNHWIALYLSGQYPGNYVLPNRFNVLLKIRQMDSVNFNDTLISMLQGKSDVEYFNTLFETYLSVHGKEQYNKLLEILNIPENVKKDPNGKILVKESLKIEEIEKYLDGLDEEKFSRYIISPLLEIMGYKNIEFKGKVNETDFGLDYYPVSYTSPGGITHYSGIQTKSKKMTPGDTSGTELNKLIEETKTAFGQKHSLNTGEQIKISEYIVFNSKDILQSAREKYFKDEHIENKKVKLYGRDGVISLITKHNLELK